MVIFNNLNKVLKKLLKYYLKRNVKDRVMDNKEKESIWERWRDEDENAEIMTEEEYEEYKKSHTEED